MTEKSYFYNGVTHGDAALAPYNAEDFVAIRASLFANGKDAVFELSDFGSSSISYAVTPNANLTVTVGGGQAIIQGVYVYTVSTNLTLPGNTSGFPRLDRIVIRINWAAGTASLAIKMGVASPIPALPELTQIFGEIYEVSLARIYIPNGLAVITAAHIIDERPIIASSSSSMNYLNENVFPNSEFIASAGTGRTATASGTTPAMWDLTSTYITTIAANEKFPQMRRGSTIQVTPYTDATTRGLRHQLNLSNGTSVPFTLKFLIEVSEGVVWVDLAGGAGAGTAWIPPTNGPIEVIIRSTTTSYLDLFIGRNLATTVQTTFRLGQITLAYGYEGAAYQEMRETILFGTPVTQDGYSLTDARSGTEIFTIDQDELAPGYDNLLTRLEFKDSGSSGTNTSNFKLYTGLANRQIIEIGRLPNSTLHAVHGWNKPTLTVSGVEFIRQFNTLTNKGGTANALIDYIGCTT